MTLRSNVASGTPAIRRREQVERWATMLARTPAMAVVYSIVAVIMTWPVARHAGTRLAADLGDPAFNAWVLSWTTGQLLQALRGDLTALANFWHANIFYPEPLTLAYSEHLFGQTLQVLPIQALTGNILLSYNLLFISTFALSGLAVYVLVRDLTGRPLAAFLAGLAYAYAPYRMGQLSHLQVLSSYWMPFALVGFHRYFRRVATGAPPAAARRALAGAAAATAMQNLSCGYFLLFFAPFAAAYCLYEMAQRRLLTTWRVWVHLGVAATVVGLVTWPFARAYLQLRDVSDLGTRSVRDLIQFSADTHAFATAARATRLIDAWLRGYSKPEGEGFPGFTILAFALIGLAWGLRRLLADVNWTALRRAHAIALGVSGVIFVGSTTLLLWFFVYGDVTVATSAWTITYRDATVVLAVALASLTATVSFASAARRGAPASDAAFGYFAIATVAAALLALGPQIEVLGQPISPGPYALLFEYVPGFNGLRVPARMLMLVALFLAVLAGLGAAALFARRPRLAPLIVVLATGGMLAEAWIVPMLMNAGGNPRRGLVAPPRPAVGAGVPPIYEFIRQSPGPMAILELPFDDPAYEMMAVFYAGHHRKPIVNGYSGMFPRSYRRTASALRDIVAHPDRAIRTLERIEPTHVLVHEGAWPSDHGRQISNWLVSIGARSIMSVGTDRLFQLPARNAQAPGEVGDAPENGAS